ncbi:MAG: DUF6152 family protein [Steroidobacteraceae bacterium]
MKSISKLPLAIALLVAAQGAWAHHSFAMFDGSKETTLVGEIRDFQWTNPHTWIHIAVTDEAGNAVVWKIEGGSPNLLQRRGWTRRSLNPGDKATILIHPAKDGSPLGSMMTVTLADGAKLGE